MPSTITQPKATTKPKAKAKAKPKASTMLAKVRECAATYDLKSAYISADAEEYRKLMKVERSGTKVTITRSGMEPLVTKATAIKAYAKTGEDRELAKALAELTRGTRLYPRKLSVFVTTDLSTPAKA